MNEVRQNLREKYRPATLVEVREQIKFERQLEEKENLLVDYEDLYNWVYIEHEVLQQVAGKLVPLKTLESVKRPTFYNKSFYEERVSFFRNSIDIDDQIYPIILNKAQDGNGYVIIDGNRRLEMLRELGVRKVHVKILNVDPATEKRLFHQLNIFIADLPEKVAAKYYVKQLEKDIAQLEEEISEAALAETEPAVTPKTIQRRYGFNMPAEKREAFDNKVSEISDLIDIRSRHKLFDRVMDYFLENYKHI